MVPQGRFFERQLQMVWNFHSIELVPQVGSKKKFAPTQFWKCKKGPTVDTVAERPLTDVFYFPFLELW